MSQPEPRQTEAANRLIDLLLRSLLGPLSAAAQVRFAIIEHNGTAEATCYTVTNSAAMRGRWIGVSPRNQPLSHWRDCEPALLAGHCVVHQPATGLTDPLFGFLASRVSSVLVCPVTSAAGNLMGGIFVVWDANDRMPEADALRNLMAASQRVAAQIAAIHHLWRYDASAARRDARHRVLQHA